jgi:hypothetical protein
VEKKLTEPTTIKSHKVAASEENPEYLVHSDKTGARAAHKPEALTSLDRPDEVEPESSSKKRDREEKEEGSEEKEKEEKDDEANEEDVPSDQKKAKLDDSEDKAAQAPAEEIRQEQAASNE